MNCVRPLQHVGCQMDMHITHPVSFVFLVDWCTAVACYTSLLIYQKKSRHFKSFWMKNPNEYTVEIEIPYFTHCIWLWHVHRQCGHQAMLMSISKLLQYVCCCTAWLQTCFPARESKSTVNFKMNKHTMCFDAAFTEILRNVKYCVAFYTIWVSVCCTWTKPPTQQSFHMTNPGISIENTT